MIVRTDEDQEAKLEREFAREYQLITRDDRLEKTAENLVAHYMGRGVLAKRNAMRGRDRPVKPS